MIETQSARYKHRNDSPSRSTEGRNKKAKLADSSEGAGPSSQDVEIWSTMNLVNDVNGTVWVEVLPPLDMLAEAAKTIEPSLDTTEDSSKALQAVQNDPELSSIVGRARWEGYNLSTQQLTDVFTYILGARNLELKDLDLEDDNLAEVSSDILAGAVVRLEKCKLENCNLTTDQLNCLFTSIREAKDLELKDLDL